jgi:hypothetical protein
MALSKLLTGSDAAHLWQIEIEQHDVGRIACDGFESRLRGIREPDDLNVTVLSERRL